MLNNLKRRAFSIGVCGKRGFSLVELVMTLVIIGFLSSVAYMSYQGYHHKARSNNAKKNLSAIVAFAETSYAKEGYYLPNLDRGAPGSMKGRFNYNYKIICDNDSNNILWSSSGATALDTSKACGSFNFNIKADVDNDSNDDDLTDNSITNECSNGGASGISDCWIGYAVCHGLADNHPAYYNDFWPKNDFHCATNRKIPKKESGNHSFPETIGRFQPIDLTNENIAETINKFHIVDHAAYCGGSYVKPNGNVFADEPTENNRRKSRNDDLFKSTEPCISIKEFAVHYSAIENIMKKLSDWNGGTDFISNPNKLVITALACKKSQSDGCLDPGATNTRPEYDVIRMDTNRVVKNYQGTVTPATP